jgi:tRNA threonylcarbamoyladenosine dehydratase
VSDSLRRYASLERLLGRLALEQLRAAHVVIVGIGGVGSWAAEALARSAVGHLTLIDGDHVGESNLNRQVHALESTLGAAKVKVLSERIAQIDPSTQVDAIDAMLEVDTLAGLIPERAVVIDAIDAARVKAALIAHCVERGQSVLACGAAGGRTEPQALRVLDLGLIKGDPLLASVRAHLRRHHGFSRAVRQPMGAMGLYSTQTSSGQAPQTGHTGAALNCSGYGSSVMVTASMGLAAAQWALNECLEQRHLRAPLS